MKKILSLIIGLVIALTVSCQSLTTMDDYRDETYSEYAYGHEIYFGTDEQYAEWMTIETPEQVSMWVNYYISYVEDEYEEFSNPEEVLRRGYGDCDDFALLIMNILYVRFNIKSDLVLLDAYINETGERVIVEGGSVNHATIGYKDVVYVVYDLRYMYVDPIIGYTYSFDHVFPNAPVMANIDFNSLI